MLQELTLLNLMGYFDLSRIVIVALLAAFIILVMGRTGFRNRVIEKTQNKFIADLFSCDLCLSFWTALAVGALFALVSLNIEYLFYPFLATPITRVLI